LYKYFLCDAEAGQILQKGSSHCGVL
jgi:hypothetical protein